MSAEDRTALERTRTILLDRRGKIDQMLALLNDLIGPVPAVPEPRPPVCKLYLPFDGGDIGDCARCGHHRSEHAEAAPFVRGPSGTGSGGAGGTGMIDASTITNGAISGAMPSPPPARRGRPTRAIVEARDQAILNRLRESATDLDTLVSVLPIEPEDTPQLRRLNAQNSLTRLHYRKAIQTAGGGRYEIRK